MFSHKSFFIDVGVVFFLFLLKPWDHYVLVFAALKAGLKIVGFKQGSRIPSRLQVYVGALGFGSPKFVHRQIYHCLKIVISLSALSSRLPQPGGPWQAGAGRLFIG